MRKHDPQELLVWVQAFNAELLAQHCQFDEAEALLASPDVQPAMFRTQHDLEGRIARATAFNAIGHLDASIRLLQEVLRLARAAGLRKAEIDAAARLVHVAGPIMVPELAQAMDSLSEPTGVPAVWATFVASVQTENMSQLFALVANLVDGGAGVLAAEISRFTLDFAGEGRELSAGQRLLLEHITFAPERPGPNPA